MNAAERPAISIYNIKKQKQKKQLDQTKNKTKKKEEEAIAMTVGRKELVSFRLVCVRQLASMDALMANNRQGTLSTCIYLSLTPLWNAAAPGRNCFSDCGTKLT